MPRGKGKKRLTARKRSGKRVTLTSLSKQIEALRSSLEAHLASIRSAKTEQTFLDAFKQLKEREPRYDGIAPRCVVCGLHATLSCGSTQCPNKPYFLGNTA